MEATKFRAHPRELRVGDWFTDPDDFGPEPGMVKVVQRHSDYHVTVEDGNGRRRDLWFNANDHVYHVTRK